MGKPLVTIIVPCKNSERTIRRCMDSIMDQTYDNWECLVVNDGGTDNTQIILEKDYCDERIKYVSNKRHGVAAARNTGIQIARGNYIVFVDSDDFLPEESLEIRVSYVVKNKDLGACFSSKIFTEDGMWDAMPTRPMEKQKGYLHRLSLFESGIKSGLEYVWDKIFDRRIIEEFGIRFDERYERYEDWLFVLDYISKCLNDFGFEDRCVYYYVKSNVSITTSNAYSRSEFYALKSLYHRYLAELSFNMIDDISCIEGCMHFLINKSIRMLYQASGEISGEELHELCDVVISDSDIQNCAFSYKSKNDEEKLDIVDLIKCKELEKLYTYLTNRSG